MSNKVKILYENKEGQELAQWLQSMSQHPDYKGTTNRKMLDDKRILYCVRANMDNSLIKFGIGGVEHGGTSAFGRLLQYINYYGEGGEFDCLGIKIFLIAANQYNPNVDGKNSAIFRKEKFLKAQLKGDTLSGRGTERVTTNIRKLFGLIKQASNKTDEDIEIERRKSDLLAQRNITSEDQVMKVTAHETPKTGKGMTKFIVHWSRPAIVKEYIKDKDGKNKRDAKGKLMTRTVKDFTTRQTYKELVNFRDGKEKADEYMENHRRAKFNL
jgi:hypothetical protein